MAPLRYLNALFATLILSSAGGVARAAPPLEAYARQPAVQLMRLSPSGQRFAFIAVDGDRRRLFVRKVGGEALAVIGLGDAKAWQIDWAGDDEVLAFLSHAGGDGHLVREHSTAIVLNLNTGKSYQVFAGRADVQAEIAGYNGVRRVGGRWLGYFRGVSLGGSPDIALYEVALASGATRRVATSGGHVLDWIVDQDGEVAARVDYDAPSQELRLLAGPAGGRVLYRKAQPMGQVEFEGLGRTPGVAVVLDSTGDGDRYGEVDLATGAFAELPQSGDYDGLTYDPQTHLLVGAALVADRGQVFFDPRLQARYETARKTFSGRRMRLISRDAGFERLLIYTDGDRDAGTFWLIDSTHREATALGEANPDVRPADLGESRMVSYKAQDGLQMDGVLTLPPGRDPHRLPLILMPHGGPIGLVDGLGYDWWTQALASRGYAVFRPNYRGSGGHGAAFRKAAFGQWGRKMQTDLSDGVAALAAQGIVDTKRVCILGASYGGYAALAGVTLQRGVYRCAVSVAGLSDLGQRLADLGVSKSYASPLARFEQLALGAAWSGDAVLKQISPVYHADQTDAPILLIHGVDDSVVPISQSEHMAEALRRAGKPYEFIRLDGEDHWLSKQKTRTEMLIASVAFIEKYNPAN